MYAIMPKESHKNKDKKNMGRIYYMKHRNKIQILGLGLALALSQASSAFASAGTVTVGKAPGETAAQAETSAAQTQEGQSASGTVVTAGDSKVSDRPFVLPAADGAAAEAVEAVILQGGPGTVSAGTGPWEQIQAQQKIKLQEIPVPLRPRQISTSRKWWLWARFC